MSFSKKILIVLLIAFLLRTAAVFWSLGYRENTDILRWKDWARIAYLHSPADTYTTKYLMFGTLPNNMPPGTLYTVIGTYEANIVMSKIFLRILHAAPGSIQWINTLLFTFLLRIPSLLADIGIGILIYFFLKAQTKSEANALWGSSLYVLNPLTIYNSAVWGQMDPINNVFFYGAIFLFFKKRYIFSLVAAFLSLYTKFSLIFLLPFLLLLIFYKTSFKVMSYAIAASLLLILLLTLPISHVPHVWLFSYYANNSLGEMYQITNFALNGWWTIFMPHISIGTPTSLFNFTQVSLVHSPEDSTKFLFLTLSQWGIGLFIAAVLPFVFKLKQYADNPKIIFLIFSVICYLAFLVLPRMHERYLFPFFPLFATFVAFEKKYIWIYVLTSLLSLLNLYLVWHPMPIPILTYQIMNAVWFQWSISLGISLIGILLYVISLRLVYAHEK